VNEDEDHMQLDSGAATEENKSEGNSKRQCSYCHTIFSTAQYRMKHEKQYCPIALVSNVLFLFFLHFFLCLTFFVLSKIFIDLRKKNLRYFSAPNVIL